METYISLALVIVLLLSFIPQNIIQQNNHITIMNAEVIVESAKEKAAQEGCFTSSIISEMNEDFEKVGINSSEVVYKDMTTKTKVRQDKYDVRELISYSIGIPIKKIIANNEFFGIPDEENEYLYWFTGVIASERLVR